MLEQDPPPVDREGTSYIGTRILIVGGVGTLLSFGLCGASAVIGRLGSTAGTVAIAGAGLLLLSILALVIGAIVLVIELIARR